MTRPPNVFVLPASPFLSHLQLKIRDKSASLKDFTHYSGQVIRLLLQSAAQWLPYEESSVTTPIGDTYRGTAFQGRVCGVSVIRAGESMETIFRAMFPDHPVGKILIQRDKESKQPRYLYSHLPPDINRMSVMLFEPMLATGGSLLKAIDVIRERGVATENIIVVNLLASPQGLNHLMESWPALKIVTSSLEDAMTETAFMRPGIGDFGDRYFGTVQGTHHE